MIYKLRSNWFKFKNYIKRNQRELQISNVQYKSGLGKLTMQKLILLPLFFQKKTYVPVLEEKIMKTNATMRPMIATMMIAIQKMRLILLLFSASLFTSSFSMFLTTKFSGTSCCLLFLS